VDRYQHFRGTLVPTYQHAESKNPEKEKIGFSQPRKPQTVQTVLTAASRGIPENAVNDSFTW
jgi:hypothetical protein